MTKAAFLSLVLCSGLSLTVHARDFIKGDLEAPVKGGHPKYASRAPEAVIPNDGIPRPMLCFNSTPKELQQDLSVELCSGALSTAPADCFRATPTDLSNELSVKLCKHAESVAPADCYKNTPTELSRDLSVQLCAYKP